MSNKLWIVVQREFATRVRKKSFIILTILMPVLMAALIFLPLALSMIKDGDRQTIAVIDNTGLYADLFESNDDYLFVPTEKMTPALRSDSTDIDAVVQITANLVDHPGRASIFSRREVSRELRGYVEAELTEAVRKQKFERYKIAELNDIIDDMRQTVEVATIRWTDEGEQESISEIATITGMLLTFLIYMFVISYGSMVMQSVVEEKTNRIVELMVSSVKPIQLLFGKIIGVGLVGLFQMLIWGLLLTVISSGAAVMAGIPAGAAPQDIPAGVDSDIVSVIAGISSLPLVEMAVMFIVYFIGGYILYASILAALGAAVNDQQDAGQLMMPIMIVMMFAFYAGFYSVQNPDGPLAFWCSFIPFTSPMVMMVRIPFGVPVYQVILSAVILFAFEAFILWVSAKIYRVGILVQGKKPSFKDIYKWLRY